MPEIDVEITGKIPSGIVEETEVWPTMLGQDDDFLGMFDFTFYRGDTKKDGEGEWAVIPEWAGDLSEKGRLNYYRDECYVENFDFVYIGNDFVLSTEKIQAEYGDAVDNKWDRMPLQILTSRDEDGRWTTFANGLNIRLRAMVTDDISNPKADVSPDLMEDGTKKGNWSFINNPSDQSDEYVLKGITSPQKLGLEVSEVGTKAICHYLPQESPSASTLSYAIDWLDPEGIFICPFNTLDTDNYKVTTTPDYDDDAVSGRILQALGKTKVEVYFMFRRWAFYNRLTTGLYEVETGDLQAGGEWRICYMPCEDELNDSTMWHVLNHCGLHDAYIDYLWPGPCDATGYHYHIIAGGSYMHLLGEVYLGLWWAPPPLSFALASLDDASKRAEFGYQLSVTDNVNAQVFELIGDETKDEAQAHFISAGGSEEDAAKIISGYNSVHTFAPMEWGWYHIHAPNVAEDYRWVVNSAISYPGGKLVNETEDPEGTFTYTGNIGRKTVFENLYLDGIYSSEFYSTYYNADYTYTEESNWCSKAPIVDEAFGVGLSPMMPGTLCAVVKVGNKPYYIWRKTAETFTERTVQVIGDSFDKPFVGFEPRHRGECYEFWQHFSGTGRKIEKILTPKTVASVPYSTYGLSDRDCSEWLGDLAFIINACGCGENLQGIMVLSGEGTVTLESSVYPIIARDFAKDGTSYYLNRTYVYNTASPYNTDQRNSW